MRHFNSQTIIKLISIGFMLFCLCFVWLPQSAWAMSTQDEIDMGQREAVEVERQIPLVKDSALQERVQKIGLRLAKVSERPDLPYTFKVLDSSEVNAFAIPGGFIYVYKGLIDLMPSDDELAGVMGHELGHVVKRHAIKEMEKGTGMNLLLALLTKGRNMLLQGVTMEMLMAHYSRNDEREADYLGFQHSTHAGYSPYAMLMGLEKLSKLDVTYQSDLFSDHPESKERVTLMKKYLADEHIHPFVKGDEKVGIVYEGNWSLPEFTDTVAGSTPLYRAYSAAGQIYQLTRLNNLSGEHFIASADKDGVGIYYDDQLLFVVTEGDAAEHHLSVDDFVSNVIQTLQEWVVLQQSRISQSRADTSEKA
jgi:beta-barrel assembly-enhancing protease